MRTSGKYTFVWIALVAVVAAVLIMMEPKVRHDSPTPDVPKANYATNQAVSVATDNNKVNSAIKRNDGKRVVRTMRFLELARQFVPEGQRAEIDKGIAKGVDAQPDRFAKFTIQYMEFFGYLKNKGLIEAYYDALKKEYLKNSNDINVLRFLAAIASIPSLNRRNEYEAWLGEMMLLDKHSDVALQLAEVKVSKGANEEAMNTLKISENEYPDEASGLYLNALRLFADNRDILHIEEVMPYLREEQRLDSLSCMMGGDILAKIDRNADAEQFYQKAISRATSNDDGIKTLCRVRCLRSAMKCGKEIEPQEIIDLRNMAANATVPIVKQEACKVLILLNLYESEQNPNHSNLNH